MIHCVTRTLFIWMTLLLFTSCERHEKAEVKKLKIGDVELAYYTRGHGDPLVMIMGFRGTLASWDPAFLEALEKRFTLILFDNRGIGLSTDTEAPLTIAQMAQDTAQLIKTLGYSRAHVLGWSMGARIGLTMALEHPEVIDHLILCSPNAGGPNQVQKDPKVYAVLLQKEVPKKEGLALLFPSTIQGIQAAGGFVFRVAYAIAMGSVPNDREHKEEIVERQADALRRWGDSNAILDRLPEIKTPTLLAGGLEDALDPAENMQTVAQRLPYAWTAYFAGNGHAFLFQEYERFSQLIEIFIDSTQ